MGSYFKSTLSFADFCPNVAVGSGGGGVGTIEIVGARVVVIALSLKDDIVLYIIWINKISF
jgi:hypothetical protein